MRYDDYWQEEERRLIGGLGGGGGLWEGKGESQRRAAPGYLELQFHSPGL